jgi:hypothetical protein
MDLGSGVSQGIQEAVSRALRMGAVRKQDIAFTVIDGDFVYWTSALAIAMQLVWLIIAFVLYETNATLANYQFPLFWNSVQASGPFISATGPFNPLVMSMIVSLFYVVASLAELWKWKVVTENMVVVRGTSSKWLIRSITEPCVAVIVTILCMDYNLPYLVSLFALVHVAVACGGLQEYLNSVGRLKTPSNTAVYFAAWIAMIAIAPFFLFIGSIRGGVSPPVTVWLAYTAMVGGWFWMGVIQRRYYTFIRSPYYGKMFNATAPPEENFKNYEASIRIVSSFMMTLIFVLVLATPYISSVWGVVPNGVTAWASVYGVPFNDASRIMFNNVSNTAPPPNVAVNLTYTNLAYFLNVATTNFTKIPGNLLYGNSLAASGLPTAFLPGIQIL